MGVFMDSMRGEILACARDMQSSEERDMLQAEYWYKRNLLQDLLDAFAEPRWVIPQRKIMSRIRITGEIMDDFGGTTGSAQGLSPYPYPSEMANARMAQMPTLKDRINNAILQAEDKLKSVKEAASILDRNPDLERLLNLMQKNHF